MLLNSNSRQAPPSQEAGNAIVEFLGLGFILMVPTLYFLLCIFALQSGAMAATAASQQAIQVAQNMERTSVNESTIYNAAAFAARDYQVEAENVSVSTSCAGDCSADSSLRVNVTVTVHLPLIPWVKEANIGQLSSSATAWAGKYQ